MGPEITQVHPLLISGESTMFSLLAKACTERIRACGEGYSKVASGNGRPEATIPFASSELVQLQNDLHALQGISKDISRLQVSSILSRRLSLPSINTRAKNGFRPALSHPIRI